MEKRNCGGALRAQLISGGSDDTEKYGKGDKEKDIKLHKATATTRFIYNPSSCTEYFVNFLLSFGTRGKTIWGW